MHRILLIALLTLFSNNVRAAVYVAPLGPGMDNTFAVIHPGEVSILISLSNPVFLQNAPGQGVGWDWFMSIFAEDQNGDFLSLTQGRFTQSFDGTTATNFPHPIIFTMPVSGVFRLSPGPAQMVNVFGDFTVSIEFADDSVIVPPGYTLANAVPEPSTWSLLLIGFAGFGFAAYRRRKHASLLPA